MSFHVPNQFRYRNPGDPYSSEDSMGNYGAFFVYHPPTSRTLKCLASGGMGGIDWEHVSVSLDNRCPNWQEMCFIKDLFWDGEDVVVQYHPKKSEYVNYHSFCLHLWRPTKAKLPTPPVETVGPTTLKKGDK